MSQERVRCILLLVVCCTDFLSASPFREKLVDQGDCSPKRFRCGSHCAPLRWRCDGYADCPEGTDEMNCDSEKDSEVSTKIESSSTSSSSVYPTVPRGLTYIDRKFSAGVKAKVGDTARLLCRVRNRGITPVSWVRYLNFEILAFGLNRTAYLREKYTPVHEPGTDDWILEISNVTTKDAGIYMCELLTSPILNHQIRLDVVPTSEKTAGDSTFPLTTSTLQSITSSPLTQTSTPFHAKPSIQHTTSTSATDETKETPCPNSGYRCNRVECIPSTWVCDGEDDCLNGEDEAHCKNSENSTSLPIASSTLQSSNLSSTAPDTTSSVQLSTSANTTELSEETTCPHFSFRCHSGVCIHVQWKCDGEEDCDDGEDEVDCANPKTPCPDSDFRCNSGVCIPPAWLCNGQKDCFYGEDEADCKNSETPCFNSGFRCNSGVCIDFSWKCDGQEDCVEGEDEADCGNPGDSTSPLTTSTLQSIISSPLSQTSTPFHPKSSIQRTTSTSSTDATEEDSTSLPITSSTLQSSSTSSTTPDTSSVQPNISAITTELLEESHCPDSDFECISGLCIPLAWVCDGQEDCPDGGDEVFCKNSETPCFNSGFRCNSGVCIHFAWKCDGQEDCDDGEDEADCENPGNSTSPLTTSTLQSITSSPLTQTSTPFHVKPSIQHTTSTSAIDETEEDPTSLPITSSTLESSSTSSTAPDTTSSVQVNTYASTKATPCQKSGFRCNNGVCIPLAWICDGDKDCPNGEDEADCKNSETPCPYSGFRCSRGICIPSGWVCDGEKDCLNGADEEDCKNSDSSTPSYHVISTSSSTTEKTYVSSTTRQPVTSTPFSTTRKPSHVSSTTRQPVTSTPSSTTRKPSRDPDCFIDDFACNNSICIPRIWRCDGKNDCPDGEDEIRCEAITCSVAEYRCDNSFCIPRSMKCDGDEDCPEGDDEFGCDGQKCSQHLWECTRSYKCIYSVWVCDGVPDCQFGEDEMDCEYNFTSGHSITTTPLSTNGTDHGCTSLQILCGERCAPAHWRCDGITDCPEGTDELGC